MHRGEGDFSNKSRKESFFCTEIETAGGGVHTKRFSQKFVFCRYLKFDTKRDPAALSLLFFSFSWSPAGEGNTKTPSSRGLCTVWERACITARYAPCEKSTGSQRVTSLVTNTPLRPDLFLLEDPPGRGAWARAQKRGDDTPLHMQWRPTKSVTRNTN